MLRVVPVDEIGEPLTSMVEGDEVFRIADGVFQRLVPRFDKGVVVAAARPRIAPGHVKRLQEDGKRHASHRMTVVRVDNFRTNAEVSGDSLKETC